MALSMDIDPSILPYTRNNEPLPPNLQFTLDEQMEKVRICIAASDERIRVVERQLLDLQKGIEALEEDIETLREDLREEKRIRDEQQDMARRLSSTVSVIRRLPPEVIALIMVTAAFSEPLSLREDRMKHIYAVSKLWRTTALSTPSLWRSHYVDLANYAHIGNHEITAHRLFSYLETWFSRAGEGTGIELELIVGSGEATSRAGLQPQDVIHGFLRTNLKFTSLRLDEIFAHPSDAQALFSSNAPSLRRLESLRMQLPRFTTESPLTVTPSRLTIDANSTMPSLGMLTIVGDCCGPVSIQFAHSRLTSLCLHHLRFGVRDVPRIITALPSLQDVSISLCAVARSRLAGGSGYHGPVFTHPSIRRVTLFARLYGQHLDGIGCPALERLSLETWNLDLGKITMSHTSAQSFSGFIQRSGARITLQLAGGCFLSTFLNHLLHTSAPGIGKLELQSLSMLPLDSDEDTTPFTLPPSVEHIDCCEALSEEDSMKWMSKLATHLEKPSDQVITVRFGEGNTAFTKRIN